METTELFKKHFPDVYGGQGVGLLHPNVQAFFEELNQICLKEDAEKKSEPLTQPNHERTNNSTHIHL